MTEVQRKPRRKSKPRPLGAIREVPDALWEKILPILRAFRPKKPTGRRTANWRAALSGIIFRMRTGCQWEQLPREFGPKSTVHDWFQRWCEGGVLERIRAVLVAECDESGGVDWQWQGADAVLGKARFGGEKTGKTPTDRGKMGTKKSVLVDGQGGPLGATIAGANVPERKMLRATIEAGYIPHIHTGGEVGPPGARKPGYKPRRWVVERTLAWLSKCRGILVRYDKKGGNYLGLIQLACALYWDRRLVRLSQGNASQNST